ncbi:MAG TPA: ABC transporter ATP-binding protein [Chthonomonadales bacterium]|nr:ABC transporter ATP-binding protein [Chthonomonadales bacterium]
MSTNTEARAPRQSPVAPGGAEGEPIVVASGLGKVYRRAASATAALQGVDLRIGAGEFCAVVGPSGAGKTTLLNLLGAMDVPTQGSLSIAGSDVARDGRILLGEGARDRLRRKHIGFIFTDFHLVPTLTALENVEMPLLWSGRSDRAHASSLLERVGLGHRLSHRPAELSGGEMQRVAIARALVNRPGLLLADEPTGNVDTRTRDSIFELFRELHAGGLTVVLATHDRDLERRVDRVVHLRGGRIVDEAE